VGVRDLKNRLSRVLRRVSEGERITITDRGRPIAILSPVDEQKEDAALWAMVREGLAHWGGGKPQGGHRRPRIRGKPISATVIEGRR
jgi:prevent-host-death family protein